MECYRQRMPVPDRIRNAPVLLPWAEPFMRAFWELASCRAQTVVAGPGGATVVDGRIPWTAMSQYALEEGMTEEVREDLIYHVTMLDLVFREHKSRR